MSAGASEELAIRARDEAIKEKDEAVEARDEAVELSNKFHSDAKYYQTDRDRYKAKFGELVKTKSSVKVTTENGMNFIVLQTT